MQKAGKKVAVTAEIPKTAPRKQANRCKRSEKKQLLPLKFPKQHPKIGKQMQKAGKKVAVTTEISKTTQN